MRYSKHIHNIHKARYGAFLCTAPMHLQNFMDFVHPRNFSDGLEYASISEADYSGNPAL